MKRAFNLALLTLAIATLAVGAFAQQTGAIDKTQKGHAQKHAGKRGEFRKMARERIAEKLGLTDEQKQRLQILRDQTKASVQALRDQKGGRESKRAKFQEIRKNAREQFLAVLTKEQKSKLQEIKKNFRAHRHGGKAG